VLILNLFSEQFIDNEQQNYAEQKTYNCIWLPGAKMQEAGVDYFLGKNTTIGVCMDRFLEWFLEERWDLPSSEFQESQELITLEANTANKLGTRITNHVANLKTQHTSREKEVTAADFDMGQFK